MKWTGRSEYGVWIIRSDNSNLLKEFSALCVVLFCMTIKIVWKDCPFLSFETFNFIQKIEMERHIC